MTPRVRDAGNTHRCPCSLFICCRQHTLDRRETVLYCCRLSNQLDHFGNGGRTKVLDRHRDCGIPNLWLTSNFPIFKSVCACECGAYPMAIQQRCDDPTIEEVLGSGGVIRTRSPLSDRKLTVPVALQVEAGRVISPTTPAEITHHLVLECLAGHVSNIA